MARTAITVQNIHTGLTSTLSHHCTICHKPITILCFKKNHVAFCTAPKNPNRPQDGNCGFRFNVKSPAGCCKHPYNMGYNAETRAESPARSTSMQRKVQSSKGKENEAVQDVEKERTVELPFNSDWGKLRTAEYKEKAAPRLKTKNKQGKKMRRQCSARR